MATNNTAKKRKQQQRQASIRLVVIAAILVCLNMLAARFHYGLDLTKEKRFTLTPATSRMLGKLDDVVVINVYLKGTFPAGFQRLSESTREILQSFRDKAGSNVRFKFINPTEGLKEGEKDGVYKELGQKGIFPINLQVQGDDDGYSEKYVFPYALVQYKGKEKSVRLLENKMGLNPLQILNYSESLIEFKLISTISQLSKLGKPQVGYIMGHGEALGMNTYDLMTSLEKVYQVDTIDLPNSMHIPNYYSTIIINKPTQPLDDREKFKIDQFVMNGGHVLWAIDILQTPMDSLQSQPFFITRDYDLNLDDQLFKYGARINSTLVEDMQCMQIPVMVNQLNAAPQMELKPWLYFPLFLPQSNHPIVKNMDGVFGKFVNTIDTIANPEIKKTILLQSSKYSRVATSPLRVSLSMTKYPARTELFRSPDQPVAVLMEGKFRSVFQNRLHPEFLSVLKDSLHREFKVEADSATSMILIADGDMMQNDFSSSQGPTEMGYWRFTKDLYANKSFVLNCMQYLTEGGDLLEARSKDTRLRLLDGGRVKEEKMKWQIVNMGLPIILVLVFASCYLFFRKRRYEK